ncbi:MAG: hypothetical protein IKN30_02220, partial [Synergistaceae bacterium]|nr:hypothetical protein [Synergistaceae bacterium]
HAGAGKNFLTMGEASRFRHAGEKIFFLTGAALRCYNFLGGEKKWILIIKKIFRLGFITMKVVLWLKFQKSGT